MYLNTVVLIVNKEQCVLGAYCMFVKKQRDPKNWQISIPESVCLLL